MRRLSVFSFLAIILFSTKVSADYSFDTPEILLPETIDGTFSIETESTSCSSGGASTPNFTLGVSHGNGNMSVNDFDGTPKSNDFLSGMAAISVPLGAKNSDNMCRKYLALVEVKEMLQIISSLEDLGMLDKKTAKRQISLYLKKMNKSMDIDIGKMLKEEYTNKNTFAPLGSEN